MYQALLPKQPEGLLILSEKMVYRDQLLADWPEPLVKEKTNWDHKGRSEEIKSGNPLKRNFCSDAPSKKSITDITEIPESNENLYVSEIYGRFDLNILGFAMENLIYVNHAPENTLTAYPTL